MTEPRQFPFGGIPVYNPQSLSKTEALAQFHVRRAVYDNLMGLLRQERPSHVLIIGTRGMGKTTLLQRVRYGVEDDHELNSSYLALVFPEEQYNLNRLHHFLLNTLDALADAMERHQNKRMLTQVEEYVDTVGKCPPDEIEEQVPKFLADISQKIQKNLLLLVDNADRLFEIIEDRQQWRLRELLSSRSDMTFFGATSQASEGIYGPERAFFEFFKIYQLVPLSFAEVRDLMLKLSESVEENESDGEKGAARRRINEWLDADEARLRTLVQLTGGNPRTTVLLFHLVLDGLDGGAREYLEQLLDQVTPTYKGRVDELPSQAQQVLDAVALQWDPVTAMKVAEETGLETNAVSTQLTRLVRQGILEKADPGDSKKVLYQIAERFFNIWYLMRASRRVRAKLRWFVEFLRVFFKSGELERMAWERIEGYRSSRLVNPGTIETTFAYLIASGAGRERFEDYLQQQCGETEQIWRPLLESIEPPRSLAESKAQTDPEYKLREAIERNPADARFWNDLGNVLRQSATRTGEAEGAYRKAIELYPENAETWCNLGALLTSNSGRAEEAESAYRKAIELDPCRSGFWYDLGSLLAKLPNRVTEAESALRKAIELDPELAGPWFNLGNLLVSTPERVAEAESMYRKVTELKPDFAGTWNNLGNLLANSKRTAEAETAYRKAIELDPELAPAWNNLGNLLAPSAERAAEAESLYRKAVELDSHLAEVWNNLGNIVGANPERSCEAEWAYRNAINVNPNQGLFWKNLGDLLARTPERAPEAESAYRQATELAPGFATFWSDLGKFLAKIPERAVAAESAYRKAIELAPKYAGFWNDLGNVLANMPERTTEAESAYREAIELDPMFARPWYNLGSLLTKNPGRISEAESAYRRSIELNPKYALPSLGLANLLTKVPERAGEAESAYRRVIELDPKLAPAWNGLAILLSRRPERFDEAASANRRVIELNPNDTWPWYRLANLLATTQERTGEAELAYRKAIELDPRNASAWYDLGNLLAKTPERAAEAELAYRKAIELAPIYAGFWNHLGNLLAKTPARVAEAESAYRRAIELIPHFAGSWNNLGVVLAMKPERVEEAETAYRTAIEMDPLLAGAWVNLGNLLASAADRSSEAESAYRKAIELIGVQEGDNASRLAKLYLAVALARKPDFPRASVAFEDALTGDPIELLAIGQQAIETFFAAAVTNGRVSDCLEAIDKKGWRDAWRPIYEALKAVEVGAASYLKRVAVEIRDPATQILHRIAPELPELFG